MLCFDANLLCGTVLLEGGRTFGVLCFDANLLCGTVHLRLLVLLGLLCFDANLLCGTVRSRSTTPIPSCVLMQIFSVVQ